MMKNIEDIQQVGKQNLDTTMKSFGVATKGFQAIAAEVADYSKKSFEDGTQALEKLLSAKSFEKAIEVQQAFLKDSYEGFVAKATKLGEIYTDIAKETYKPLEAFVPKAPVTK
jgi:phasin family protein